MGHAYALNDWMEVLVCHLLCDPWCQTFLSISFFICKCLRILWVYAGPIVSAQDIGLRPLTMMMTAILVVAV